MKIAKTAITCYYPALAEFIIGDYNVKTLN